jgi:hypothetical protein
MSVSRRLIRVGRGSAYLLLGVLASVCCLSAHTDSGGNPATQERTAEHDGLHDFDALVGHWIYHLKRRLHPLTGSNTWVEYEGTGICRKIWDGAEIDQAAFDGPSGHIEGFVVRMYSADSHQWRLYWASRKSGVFDPPQVGKFKDGRGRGIRSMANPSWSDSNGRS